MINSIVHRPIWLFLYLLLTLSLATATPNTIQTVMVTVTTNPIVPTPSSYTSPSDFKETVMTKTNICRKRHHADPLVWNNTLADFAQNWAEKCNWKHSVNYSPCSFSVSSQGTDTAKRIVPTAKTSPSATPTPPPPSALGPTKLSTTTSTNQLAFPRKLAISHNSSGRIPPRSVVPRLTVVIRIIRKMKMAGLKKRRVGSLFVSICLLGMSLVGMGLSF